MFQNFMIFYLKVGIIMNTVAFKQLYDELKNMSLEQHCELINSATTEQEQEFYELITNYILQMKQREVIAENRF